MKLGTQTLNDSQHEWMKIFARLVESGSNGRIKPELLLNALRPARGGR
jgi:TRAP-type C4-dicarboxylate transport system substrate-binding protein